jgi:hypothetical protein
MPDEINSIEYFVPQRTNIRKLFMVSYQKEQILDRTNKCYVWNEISLQQKYQ